MAERRGFFVTLEGGEGAGKSTQLRLLADRLERDGHEVVPTREPGGTPGAEALRKLLLCGAVPLSDRAQILAHMAARVDHMDHLILPALERGAIVLCDRFHDSTVAYQGYGIGGGDRHLLAFIDAIRRELSCEPDLTLLLTVPPEVAAARLASRRGKPDRYESEGAAFHARVAAGFEAMAHAEPDRIVTVGAEAAPEAVTERLYSVVCARLDAR